MKQFSSLPCLKQHYSLSPNFWNYRIFHNLQIVSLYLSTKHRGLNTWWSHKACGVKGAANMYVIKVLTEKQASGQHLLGSQRKESLSKDPWEMILQWWMWLNRTEGQRVSLQRLHGSFWDQRTVGDWSGSEHSEWLERGLNSYLGQIEGNVHCSASSL